MKCVCMLIVWVYVYSDVCGYVHGICMYVYVLCICCACVYLCSLWMWMYMRIYAYMVCVCVRACEYMCLCGVGGMSDVYVCVAGVFLE